jgi:hypothetical protein
MLLRVLQQKQRVLHQTIYCKAGNPRAYVTQRDPPVRARARARGTREYREACAMEIFISPLAHGADCYSGCAWKYSAGERVKIQTLSYQSKE